MPEKDFDKKYDTTSDNDFVKNFHSNRRMFAIKDNKLFVATPNVSYSHARWFEIEGWIKNSDDPLMKEIVRGYVDNDGVYFYKGYDFSVDFQAERTMIKHLGQLVERVAIDNSKHLYGGIIKQDGPGKWPPKKDYGIISDIMKK
jgi:hypothetical protein